MPIQVSIFSYLRYTFVPSISFWSGYNPHIGCRIQKSLYRPFNDWANIQQDVDEFEDKFDFVKKFVKMTSAYSKSVDPEVLYLYPQFNDKLYKHCKSDMSFKKSVKCELTLIATFCTLIRRLQSTLDEVDELEWSRKIQPLLRDYSISLTYLLIGFLYVP